MTAETRHRHHFIVDLIWISVSILIAILISRSGYIESLLGNTSGLAIIESFVAGLFFTSIFTTAPSIAALGEIAQSAQSVWIVAFFGGLGALCGDLFILKVMKDRFAEDIWFVIGKAREKRFKSILKVKLFRWSSFFIGALVITSPIPDEFGLMMMGLSNTKLSLLAPVSFIFNFVGIVIIGLVALSV